MITLNMINCPHCGRHHPTTKGCNPNDVRKYKKETEKYKKETEKYKKETEKYRSKRPLVEDNEVTQQDIDSIISEVK